ncbi:Uncharacterized mitochondrial protein AtMg00810 [Striga hermonthica]|uniref:Uncharacterized mitochondrial protein AtMg00810 n=1 Tax=Striga hermonthica TaxID=68872 RepID=A0A9N7RCS3_STRHE|nr:Uncharacterized mitochondrial protein AtMg00810 [Striga hermonthica]
MVEIPYASAVGCLMNAMVCTRPDLAHAVGQVCKYMSRPGKQHWEAVKWIFRYLKGTAGHGIVFGDQRLDPLVVGYVDSDYAGDLDNRRSTTGAHVGKMSESLAIIAHLLGRKAISCCMSFITCPTSCLSLWNLSNGLNSLWVFAIIMVFGPLAIRVMVIHSLVRTRRGLNCDG